MFYLEIKCGKCLTLTELYSEPNETIEKLKCPDCGCRDMLLEKAQSIDAKAIVHALQDLNTRLKAMEALVENRSEDDRLEVH